LLYVCLPDEFSPVYSASLTTLMDPLALVASISRNACPRDERTQQSLETVLSSFSLSHAP
jgi:hypothetical protein